MKAIVKFARGANSIDYRDVPEPVCGPDDVIVRVRAAGLCGSDIRMMLGDDSIPIPVPVVLGHEFAGDVVEKGAHVEGYALGDRVVSDNTGYVCGKCWACATGQYFWCAERKMIGGRLDGGFTKYVKIGGPVLKRFTNCLMHIPEGLSYQEAAIMDPACNGYKGVIQDGGLRAGETVVLFGQGAIGLCAAEAAQAGGAGQIILVVHRDTPEREAVARQLGVTHIVNFETEDLEAAILRLTNGVGADLVVNCAGPNKTVQQSIRIARKAGRVVLYGYDAEPYGFNLNEMIHKGVSLIGHSAYNYESWQNVFRLLEAGKMDLKKLITHTLPMSRYREGVELVRTHQAIKVILEYDE